MYGFDSQHVAWLKRQLICEGNLIACISVTIDQCQVHKIVGVIRQQLTQRNQPPLQHNATDCQPICR